MVNRDVLRKRLESFTGTENYYEHWSRRLKYTDGVRHLVEEASAYWLLDLIASYQQEPNVEGLGFQVWEFTRQGKRGVAVMREDANQPAIVEQVIEYTDFPLESITLWLADGVALLPSEY